MTCHCHLRVVLAARGQGHGVRPQGESPGAPAGPSPSLRGIQPPWGPAWSSSGVGAMPFHVSPGPSPLPWLWAYPPSGAPIPECATHCLGPATRGPASGPGWGVGEGDALPAGRACGRGGLQDHVLVPWDCLPLGAWGTAQEHGLPGRSPSTRSHPGQGEQVREREGGLPQGPWQLCQVPLHPSRGGSLPLLLAVDLPHNQESLLLAPWGPAPLPACTPTGPFPA